MTQAIENQVVVSDALDFLRALPDASVPLFLFSPPYNLGNSSGGAAAYARRRGHYPIGAPMGARGGGRRWYGGPLNGYGDGCDDNLPWERYIAWQYAVVAECWRCLPDVGAIYYVHKPRVIDGVLFDPDMFIPETIPIRQRLVRALGSGVNNTPTAYCPTHEEILVIAKSEFRLRDRGASGVGSVWYIPHSGHDTNSWHPAPFPLALAERVLETTAPALVCDPFSGSGTTARAAKRYGIPFIGCDRNAAYVERANLEVSKERRMTTRQTTMKVLTDQESFL